LGSRQRDVQMLYVGAGGCFLFKETNKESALEGFAPGLWSPELGAVAMGVIVGI